MSSYSVNKILVPIDLSDTSLNSIDTAVAISKRNKADIIILNVTESLPGIFHEGNGISSVNIARVDVLTALTGAIQHINKVKPALIQKNGHVVESIIETSISEQCDLIVMGTHGASGFRDGFIGSNTYGVIKHSACPVLTVPPKQKFTSFKNVLFPIRPVSGALMRYDIACHFLSGNSTLAVLGLSSLKIERETDMLDKVVQEIKDDLEKDRTKVVTAWGKEGSVADDILQFAQQINPELIVLTPVLDAVTKSNFIGPHSQKVINCCKAPLLTIKQASVPMFA